MDVRIEALPVFKAFQRSPYRSGKYTSYFPVYQRLLQRYIGRPIVFVEVGVLNGGSLFMWRDLLGPEARIIGVEFNPVATKWREHGFEIFIGDQSDPHFWKTFFAEVGQVDVLLDDGGHSNVQQITTVASALPYIRDGGRIIVEDVHTSYWSRFGNPSAHSFISFAKRMIDGINARSPTVPQFANDYGSAVTSIEFFESIVAINVDRSACIRPDPIDNEGETMQAENFFIYDQPAVVRAQSVVRTVGRLSRFDRFGLGRKVLGRANQMIEAAGARRQTRQSRHFFD